MKPISFINANENRELPPVPQYLIENNEKLTALLNNAQTLEEHFALLETVYAYLDRYNDFVATFTVCSKGCNYCCKMDVSASRFEAMYIAEKNNIRIDFKKTRKYTTGHKKGCPFIAKDGSCSIYHSRPFNCRTFHTLDNPKYCLDKHTPHQVYGAADKGYGVHLYTIIAYWLNGVHQHFQYQTLDVRDWFPEGLKS